MAGRLSSKVVIVTGGSAGIGRAVAARVVADGGAVVLAGRRSEPGERAAAELRAGGGRARFAATDVTVEGEVERLVETAVAEFGRLDGAQDGRQQMPGSQQQPQPGEHPEHDDPGIAPTALPLVSTTLSDLLPRVFPVDVTKAGLVLSRVRRQVLESGR